MVELYRKVSIILRPLRLSDVTQNAPGEAVNHLERRASGGVGRAGVREQRGPSCD